jgi:signal transduction histidine kinase
MRPLENAKVLLCTAGAGWAQARAEALRAAGAEVRTSHPCADLLLALADLAPHLVLVADVSGELDAPSVVRAVRAHQPGVPCLVLTDDPGPLAASGQAAVLASGAPPEALARAAAAAAAPALRAELAETRLLAVDEDARARRRQLDELRGRLEVLEHDLRTPLGVIVGFASNLRDEIDGPATPAQREGAAQIVKAALRMAGLLDDTLELARARPEGEAPAAVARRAQRRQLDLAALAADTVALFRDEAARRGVALEIGGEAPVMLWGDAAKLGQAIANLCANALKFTPAGGRVECAVRLRGGGAAERRHAELVVSDSGPGVPVEERARVFERGVRLERDREVPGRGLGLAVCRDVARLHGGSIAVEPSAAGGAAFVLALPLDLRTRAPAGVLVVREGAGDAVIDALVEADGLTTISAAQLERFLPAAAAAEAVVVVPHGGALDLALQRLRGGAP